VAGRFPEPVPEDLDRGEWNRRLGVAVKRWALSIQAGMGGIQGTPLSPSEIQAGASSDNGTSQAPSPSGHSHSVDTAAPSVDVGAGAPAEGNGTALMRASATLRLGIGTTRYDTLIRGGSQWERKRYAPTPVDLVTAQLPAATGVVLTATANTVLRSFRLVNVSGAARTVNLYVRPGGAGTRYPLMPFGTVIAAGDQYATDPGRLFVPLEAGDTLEGDASAATSVDIGADGEDWTDFAEVADRPYAGLVSNVLATLATVPAGERWLVKYIGAVNISAGAVALDLRIVRNATTIKVINVSIPAGAMVSPLEYFIVLQAGDTIEAVAAAAASISVVVGASVTVP